MQNKLRQGTGGGESGATAEASTGGGTLPSASSVPPSSSSGASTTTPTGLTTAGNDIEKESVLAAIIIQQQNEREQKTKEEIQRAYKNGMEVGRRAVLKEYQDFLSRLKKKQQEKADKGVQKAELVDREVEALAKAQFMAPQRAQACAAERNAVLRCYKACLKAREQPEGVDDVLSCAPLVDSYTRCADNVNADLFRK